MSVFFTKLKNFFIIIFNALKVAFLAVKKALKIASNWIMDIILKKGNFIIFTAIFTIVALVLRVKVIDFQSPDYLQFLKGWTTQIAENGGFKNFGAIHGYDYTMPYLYILTTVSYLKPEHWIYGIKAVSIFFDFVLALFIGLTAKKICKTNTSFLVGYGLALLLPNVILNSAIWGQCDVMYSAFIIISIYFMLCNKGRLAMLFYGVSFCLKIQAIFFLPIILLVMAKKKINFFYFIYSFLAILALNIPAFCMGIGFNRAIIEPIKTQTSEYTNLSSNAVNLYFIIDKMAHYGMYDGEPNVGWREWFAPALIAFAIGVVVLAFLIIYRKKFTFTPKRLVLISYFFAMLVPYVLPHMHERYWYLSDALAVLFIICYRKHFYVAFLSCYSSFRICLNYIFDTGLAGENNRILLVLLMLLAIILTFRLIWNELKQDDEIEFLNDKKVVKSGAISQNSGENLDINKNFIVTDLTNGDVVNSSLKQEVVITEQSLEEFLQEETQEEKDLENVLTKAFGSFEFGEDEVCSCHTEESENKE